MFAHLVGQVVLGFGPLITFEIWHERNSRESEATARRFNLPSPSAANLRRERIKLWTVRIVLLSIGLLLSRL
jgi:hypothetical protein